MYTVLYMSGSTRTQIYLTPEQREAIDVLMQRDGRSLAWVVRKALDQYLAGSPAELDKALDLTFGSVPDITVPSRKEWNRFPPDAFHWPEKTDTRRRRPKTSSPRG